MAEMLTSKAYLLNAMMLTHPRNFGTPRTLCRFVAELPCDELAILSRQIVFIEHGISLGKNKLSSSVISSNTTHQANIFGTEQDRVNCSFYYKVRAVCLCLKSRAPHKPMLRLVLVDTATDAPEST